MARYAELRADGLRQGDGGKQATEFYREHRIEMDAGANAAWESRYNHDELSAIQHAMNLKLQDKAAFFAEYQNEPIAETVEGNTNAGPEDVLAKVTPGLTRARSRPIAAG